MRLFMDRHDLNAGVTAEDVAKAHVDDLAIQDRFGVKYLTYWYDYDAGLTFCLVEAPDEETAARVHREAHGLEATDIIEVEPTAVEVFLGKIEHPQPGERWEATAFRAILFTDMAASTEMTQRLGDAAAMEVLRVHDRIVRRAIGAGDGREVKHTGDGIMASFDRVGAAVQCAIRILGATAEFNASEPDPRLRLRIGLSAGEPVTQDDDLFGAAVQLASRLCDRAEVDQILVSSPVRDLAIGKGIAFADLGEMSLKGFPEPVRVAEVRWREAGA
jgi:class 3 adenylate cyclase